MEQLERLEHQEQPLWEQQTEAQSSQNFKMEDWVSVDLHRKVREQLDPSSRFLSDDDIQKIIRMCYGNELNVVRQCLLGLSVHAEIAGQITEAVRFRRLLFAFESGTFSLSSDNSNDDGIEE